MIWIIHIRSWNLSRKCHPCLCAGHCPVLACSVQNVVYPHTIGVDRVVKGFNICVGILSSLYRVPFSFLLPETKCLLRFARNKLSQKYVPSMGLSTILMVYSRGHTNSNFNFTHFFFWYERRYGSQTYGIIPEIFYTQKPWKKHIKCKRIPDS